MFASVHGAKPGYNMDISTKKYTFLPFFFGFIYETRIAQKSPVINTFFQISYLEFPWQKRIPFCRHPNKVAYGGFRHAGDVNQEGRSFYEMRSTLGFARRRGHRRRRAETKSVMSKPRETVGRKAAGLWRCKPLCRLGCSFSKPQETVGRKAKKLRGLKRAPLARHGSPAAGSFASEMQRKDVKKMKNLIGTMAKRGLAFSLALVMCVSLLPTVSLAAEGDEEGAAPEITVVSVPETPKEVSNTETVKDSDTPSDTPKDDGAKADETNDKANENGVDAGKTDDKSTEDSPKTGETNDKAKETKEADVKADENGNDAKENGDESKEDGTKPADPTEGDTTDADEPGDNSTEPADDSNVVEPFPVDGTEEEKLAWYIKNVDRTQEQTEGLDTSTGSEKDVPKEPTEGPNWNVFWNEETKKYELTYEIDENAQGDQTVDLTKALELMNDYAASAQKPVAPGIQVSEEEKAQYEAAKKAYDKNLAYICRVWNSWNSAGANSGAAEKIIAEQGMEAFCKECTKPSAYPKFGTEDVEYFMNPPQDPEANVDKTSPEYQEYLEMLADYQRRKEANVLEPGDIRNFMIYITTKSGHTYKYKDGSFTLTTPALGENETGVLGFDGQELGTGPNGHISAERKYTVSAAMQPIKDLLMDAGVPEKEIKSGYDTFQELLKSVGNNPEKGGDEAVQKIMTALNVEYTKTDAGSAHYDPISYSFANEDMTKAVTDYLVTYYSDLDGVTYTDWNDVVAKSKSAQTDVSSTENVHQADLGFTFGGEDITASYGPNFKFNNFYQNLLSFIYGDEEKIEELLGDPIEADFSNHPTFVPNNWSSNYEGNGLDLDYSVVLEQYMSHQEAWEKADSYFSELLEKGLSAKNATAATLAQFAMSINVDGNAMSNDWQLTKWGWLNSIQLEQMDIDFNLSKKDQAGETITSGQTEFQVYYIEKNDTEEPVKMYCTYDEDTNAYTFVPEPSTVWTKDGKLNISYAMMKDVVYYLQEQTAPEGYEKDTNVYIVMSEDDYNQLTDEDKASLGDFDKHLDMTTTEDGLKVNADFVNVKIVTPDPKPSRDPKPDPTPDPTPDPNPDPPVVDIPEEDPPLVDIPEEDPPLVDIPEEDPPLADIPQVQPPVVNIPDKQPPLVNIPDGQPPLVDIPEEDVPLADVPKTGDLSHGWYLALLLSACALPTLALLKKREQDA